MKNTDVRKLNISLIIIIYSFSTLLFFSYHAFSAESYEKMEFYNGVRALGMGGVVVATVNDETALISNPAALGKLRNKFLTLADPEIQANKTAYQYLEEKPGDIFSQEPQTILDKLNTNQDNHYHVRGQIFPSYVVPNFGMGLLGSWTVNGEVLSETSEFDIFYRHDYAAILGYNLRFFDGRVKIGFNARYINRAEADEKVANTSTDLKWDTMVKEGTGVASDIGILLTAPWSYLPTLGAVLRDVGDTSYTLSSGSFYESTERPNKTKSTLDVGFSVTPILAKHIRLQIAAELRDVLDANSLKDDGDNTTEDMLARKMHAGLEFNIYDKLFFRGGYHQGYWSGGLEIAGPILSIQAASYAEELGDKGSEREDRRYVLKLSLRF